MRKLAFVFLLLSQWAFGTASVSGKLVTPDGSALPLGSFAQFDLKNCGGNYPTVAGASITSQKIFNLAADGTWSGTLYRNDEISCNGSYTTWWRLSYWVKQAQSGPARDFLCSQSSCVFDGTGGLTPMTTYPAPTPPSPPLISLQPKLCSFPVAGSTWTCTHNFGVQQVEAIFYDSSNKVIVPDTATATDVNTYTATWLQPQAGYALILYAGNSTLSVLNPNYLIGNPTSSQSVLGDYPFTLGGSLSAKRAFSSVAFAGQFTGTGSTAINNAIADFGSANGIVWVGNTVSSGAASSTLNNVGVWDFRRTQALIGNGAGYEPIFLADCYNTHPANSNRVFCAAFQAHSPSGGTGVAAEGESVGLFAGGERTGGTAGAWAFNVVMNCAVTGNVCYGIDDDFNAGYDSAITTNASDQQLGLRIVSGSTHHPLAALAISATTPATGAWLIGADIQNWGTFGARIGAPVVTGNPNLELIPRANDSNIEAGGRTAADNAWNWWIANNGNGLFGAVAIANLTVNGGQAVTGTTGTGSAMVTSNAPTITGTTALAALALNGSAALNGVSGNGTTLTTNQAPQISSIQFPRTNVALVNGANNDVALSGTTFAKITGPSAVFNITGFAGGADGRVLYLYNSVAFAMTISNNNAGSVAANRILTLTGGDVTLRAGQSFASFIYDSAQSLWIMTGSN